MAKRLMFRLGLIGTLGVALILSAGCGGYRYGYRNDGYYRDGTYRGFYGDRHDHERHERYERHHRHYDRDDWRR